MTETEHILGIVNSFVLSQYRERLRAKPLELLDAFYHELPDKLDPRFFVPLTGVVKGGSGVRASALLEGPWPKPRRR